ncbi:MAG: glycosyltransferase family 25 protein [Devosia sp.]
MRVYYINVAAHLERRDFMEGQFRALGLAAERIDAMTPAGLTTADLETWCNPRRGTWLTPMELCCSLSHVAALNAFIASDADFGLILEDDAVLSARLPQFLTQFEAEPAGIDLLRLETRHENLRLLPDARPAIEGVQFYTSHSWASGSAGYIVSRRAAERIAASRLTRLHASDRFLFNPYLPLLRHLVTRQANPALVIQADQLKSGHGPKLVSQLADRHIKRSAQAPFYWRRRPARIANWIRRDIIVAAQKAWHQYVRGAKKTPVPFAPD